MTKKDINLIPTQYIERLRQRRDLAVAAVICGTSALALVGLWLMLCQAVTRAGGEARVLRAAAGTLRSRQMELVALASEKESILKELTELAGKFEGGQWLAPLAALSKAPDTVLLTRVDAGVRAGPGQPAGGTKGPSAEAKHLLVGGVALSSEDLSRFVVALNHTGRFRNVEINLTRSEEFRGVEAIYFELECIVAPLAAAAVGAS